MLESPGLDVEHAAKRWKGAGACGGDAFAASPGKGSGKQLVRSSGDPSEEGEVRYRDPASAQRAVQLLDRGVLMGQPLRVALDPLSPDGTKVVVTYMPAGIDWRDLKNHFGQAGDVHYANVGRTTQPEAGMGRGFGVALPGNPCVGEVRYTSQQDALKAQQSFNGRTFKGSTLLIKPDLSSWHGTKLLVFNIPVGTDWPELRAFFEPVGQIEFCGIDCNIKGKGKSWGKGSDSGYPFVGVAPACGSGCSGHGVAAYHSQAMQGGGEAAAAAAAAEGGEEPLVGEVRFESPAHAEQSVGALNGSQLGDASIRVVQDGGCRDGSRVLVFGIAAGTSRQMLKDHFERVGAVAFAGWKGKGGGKGFGGFDQGKGWAGKEYLGPPSVLAARGLAAPHSSSPGAAHGGGFGAGGGGGGGGGMPFVGEVRYSSAAEAGQAVAYLSGTTLGDKVISVVQDGGCRDGSRVLVFNLPDSIERHTLQEYFSQIGTVAFAGWKGKGKGWAGKDALATPSRFSAAGAAAPAAAGFVSPASANAKFNGRVAQPGLAALLAATAGAGASAAGSGGAAEALSAAAAVAAAAPAAPGAPVIGEVQYERPEEADLAVQMLSGSQVGSATVQVVKDGGCREATRVLVIGLHAGTAWQALKDHFSQAGTVAYAGCKDQQRQLAAAPWHQQQQQQQQQVGWQQQTQPAEWQQQAQHLEWQQQTQPAEWQQQQQVAWQEAPMGQQQAWVEV